MTGHGTTAPRHGRWRRAGLATAAVGALLAGCSGGGTPPAPPAPPPAPAATTAEGRPTEPGCPAGGDAVPGGASVAQTADLDHDGAPDELWLADVGGRRLLGVRTASGAVFSTAFTGAAPQRASAVGQELGPELAVVLLDLGRSVPLYAVAGCALSPARNPQGQPYTFDLGFTGFGTGVGCRAGAGPQRWDLYGLLAHQAGDGSWTVTGTRINLDRLGEAARNGGSRDLVTGADAQAPEIAAARTVTCGDQTSGPTEPES